MGEIPMEKLSMDALGRKSAEEFRNTEKYPVIAVLENIRSAYNVGSVFRTADAFLLEAVYISGYTAHPPHKEIKKTALGAEDSVTWKHFKKIDDAIADLRSQGYRIFAVEQVTNSISLENFEWLPGEKLAFIFGNEVTGVDEPTLHLCDGCVEIPQMGTKHSLNIATAAGVVLWEVVRKRLASVEKMGLPQQESNT